MSGEYITHYVTEDGDLDSPCSLPSGLRGVYFESEAAVLAHELADYLHPHLDYPNEFEFWLFSDHGETLVGRYTVEVEVVAEFYVSEVEK